MRDDDRADQIAGLAAAHEKMTDEERQAEIDGIRKQLGILSRNPHNVDEGPYEADTTKESDMA